MGAYGVPDQVDRGTYGARESWRTAETFGFGGFFVAAYDTDLVRRRGNDVTTPAGTRRGTCGSLLRGTANLPRSARLPLSMLPAVSFASLKLTDT